MSNSILQSNNSNLITILETINNLPNASNVVLQEKTITPSSNEQVVIADNNYDGLSKVIVVGEPNLTPSNIPVGISLFGIDGTREDSGSTVKTCTINVNNPNNVDNVSIHVSAVSNDSIELVSFNSIGKTITVENVVCGTIMYLYCPDEGYMPSFNHDCIYLEHPDLYRSYIVPYLGENEELTIMLEEDW